MRNNVQRIAKVALLTPFVFLGGFGFSRPANAQNQELQERVAEIKEAAAKNKQAMAQYTWVEQINIKPSQRPKQQSNTHPAMRYSAIWESKSSSPAPAAGKASPSTTGTNTRFL
jgi:hypothetical protein